MKLYAPKYYESFSCIADRCSHSCCIGWEIDVDAETLNKYDALTDGYGRIIKNSIDRTETPCFTLCAGDRCPHLNEKGLCNIILSVGEDFLCEICREHPRFYHDTAEGMEVGLGMACEEACRLILESDSYADMVEVGEVAGDADEVDFDVIAYREWIFSVLSDRSTPYTARLSRIAETFGVSLSICTDAEWRTIFKDLEYLNDADRAMLLQFSSAVTTPPALDDALERALAYFIYRHCSNATNEEDLCVSLGFCLLCERLLASVAAGQPQSELVTLARIISEEIEYSEENTQRLKDVFLH